MGNRVRNHRQKQKNANKKKTKKWKADRITATESLVLQQSSPQKALGCMGEMSLHTLKAAENYDKDISISKDWASASACRYNLCSLFCCKEFSHIT